MRLIFRDILGWVGKCERKETVERNVVYHLGSDTNYAIYCFKDEIPMAQEELMLKCLNKLDNDIKEAKKRRQEFMSEFTLISPKGGWNND